MVSIHAPAWGATIRMASASARAMFQFTRPRGARRAGAARLQARCSFNSRARVGRDSCVVTDYSENSVSIHAPAWGATAAPRCNPHHRGGFNSRARVGRDAGVTLSSGAAAVSIHAPAWGAT